MQFALGWWLFIDGAFLNGTLTDASQIAVEHWAPGVTATLALVVINMINIESLTNEDLGYSDPIDCTPQ